MPAFAKFIAMPPPMVPAPMMAAALIGRVGVPSGRLGILAAARSAKKRCLRAFDSVDCTSCVNRSRSSLSPSSNGLDTDAATASTHFAGAGNPFELAPTEVRAQAKKASAFGLVDLDV